LADESLRTAVDDSRKDSQEVDRLLVFQQLPKHLQDAADLLAADKLEEARAAYYAVLDAVQSQGTNSPDALRAADRAKDGLRRVDARQAAIAAERSRQEAERVAAEQRKAQEAMLAKQRMEEEARNAAIRATVSGGAWIVKGGGSSDLLRGMKVYLLKPECGGTTIREYYKNAADSAKEIALLWRKAAKDDREKPDEYGIWKRSADEYDSKADALDEYANTVTADAKKIADRMDVRDAYNLMRKAADSEPDGKQYPIVVPFPASAMPLGAGFGHVVQECAQKTVQVNIDGKFLFDAVPRGKYYIYAYWSTEFSSTEWLIPLNVKESGAISQDLFNDTAEVIWNKPE